MKRLSPSTGTRVDRPSRTVGSSPLAHIAYALARDTAISSAASATRKSKGSDFIWTPWTVNTPFVQFSVILYRVTSFRPTDNPEESAELVADSRIRAVLPRPELDFYWSTRLVPALEPEPLFGEIERLDDGREVDPWLVAPGFRTKRLAIGSLARLVDEFERLGRKPAAGNVLAFARRWTWLAA